jgi:hypothetical protein
MQGSRGSSAHSLDDPRRATTGGSSTSGASERTTANAQPCQSARPLRERPSRPPRTPRHHRGCQPAAPLAPALAPPHDVPVAVGLVVHAHGVLPRGSLGTWGTRSVPRCRRRCHGQLAPPERTTQERVKPRLAGLVQMRRRGLGPPPGSPGPGPQPAHSTCGSVQIVEERHRKASSGKLAARTSAGRPWRITVDCARGEHDSVVRPWDSAAATSAWGTRRPAEPEGLRDQPAPSVRVHAVR